MAEPASDDEIVRVLGIVEEMEDSSDGGPIVIVQLATRTVRSLFARIEAERSENAKLRAKGDRLAAAVQEELEYYEEYPYSGFSGTDLEQALAVYRGEAKP